MLCFALTALGTREGKLLKLLTSRSGLFQEKLRGLHQTESGLVSTRMIAVILAKIRVTHEENSTHIFISRSKIVAIDLQ